MRAEGYRPNSVDSGTHSAAREDSGQQQDTQDEGFNDVKEGDLLEAYRVDEIKRTLDS